MGEERMRAPRLQRYGLSNITSEREGIDWMDGISSLNFDCFPLIRHNIPESHLTLANLPPFYRLLSNGQVHALHRWAIKGNLSREAMGHYWPGDFNSDGKVKRSRLSWEIGPNEPPRRPLYRTNFSCGRPMKSMAFVAAEDDEDGDENGLKQDKAAGLDGDVDGEGAHPRKLILLHDSKDEERIHELQCEIDTLRASLKLAQSKYDGLQAQMAQIESALSIRQDLVTNAIVTYYFAYTNIRLLAPSITALVDETVSPDDISLAAGGMATLDHRVRVVNEIAQRMNIPISIPNDIVGGSDEAPPPANTEGS